MQPEPIELLALTAAALAFSLLLASPRSPRQALVIRGTAGLASAAAIALVPTVDLLLVVVLAVGVLHAAVGGKRSFATRLRAPGAAVALLALALGFARVEGPQVLERFAAVGLVAGLGMAVGILPFLHEFDSDEEISASPIVWLAFLGPILATSLVQHARHEISPDAGGDFGALLIGIGLLNVVGGNLGAWLTPSTTAAWRYSFLADWGLGLTGFGLTVADGSAAALLVLFTVILGRLPLYLVFLNTPSTARAVERPVNFVMAALLAGSAPFAGFAARVLLLRGATELYWPLALVLALGMLLWLPGSLRLGRSLRVPRGQQAFGVAAVIALNLAAGLYPLPLLAASGH